MTNEGNFDFELSNLKFGIYLPACRGQGFCHFPPEADQPQADAGMTLLMPC